MQNNNNKKKSARVERKGMLRHQGPSLSLLPVEGPPRGDLKQETRRPQRRNIRQPQGRTAPLRCSELETKTSFSCTGTLPLHTHLLQTMLLAHIKTTHPLTHPPTDNAHALPLTIQSLSDLSNLWMYNITLPPGGFQSKPNGKIAETVQKDKVCEASSLH